VNQLSDEELIARCAAGERGAMDVLVERYHAKLLDFALRQVHNRETAADIAQVTLVRVYERAVSFQARASFRTWMYAIALNYVRDSFRKRNVRRESLCSELEDWPDAPVPAAEPSPEDLAVEAAQGSALWRTVDKLPERQRTAVLLRFRQQLKYDEIAEIMGAPPGTARSWIHHALKALRRSIAPPDCEGQT